MNKYFFLMLTPAGFMCIGNYIISPVSPYYDIAFSFTGDYLALNSIFMIGTSLYFLMINREKKNLSSLYFIPPTFPVIGYGLLLLMEANYWAPITLLFANFGNAILMQEDTILRQNTNFIIGATMISIILIVLILFKIEADGKFQIVLREYNQKNYTYSLELEEKKKKSKN